jgi:inosose dehydratase
MSEQEKLFTRRTFIALGGGVLGSIAAVTGCAKPVSQEQKAGETAQSAAAAPKRVIKTDFPQDVPYLGFRMGVQSYCFRNFKSLDEMIKMVKTLNLAHVEIWPDGHLPVGTAPDALKAAVDRVHEAGLTIDACGVVAFKNDEAEARKIFEYAKALGVLAISAGPTLDSLPLLDKLTAEYNIPIAIHNHGPEDKIFGSLEQVRTAMIQTSNRIGFCVDLGHFYRAGVDPMLAIDEFANRVYGIHLKDIVPDSQGKWGDVIVGTGKINLPALFTKLEEIRFKGYFSLEYESDPENPLPKLQECLDNIKKAAATLA